MTPRTDKRFEKVYCSSCGECFGPGDHGFSHCEDHEGLEVDDEGAWYVGEPPLKDEVQP